MVNTARDMAALARAAAWRHLARGAVRIAFMRKKWGNLGVWLRQIRLRGVADAPADEDPDEGFLLLQP